MSFEIQGKLHRKYDTEEKSAKFSKREFVLETEKNSYKNYIKIQLKNERCNLLDAYNEGQDLKVSFDLEGREWEGKYFTNITAWKIENAGGASVGGVELSGFPENPFPEDFANNQDETEILPF